MAQMDAKTWVVKSGDTTHEVLADNWREERHGDDDYPRRTTRFYRNGELVAEFRYWESIVAKGEGNSTSTTRRDSPAATSA